MGRQIDPVQVARNMIALGFVPIPLGGDDTGKKPLLKWQSFQYNDTRPSDADIIAEFQRLASRSDAVAVLHGETNGTICIDADTTAARDQLFAAFPDAPWKVLSGKGGHVFFAPPPELDQKNVRQGIGVEMQLPSGEWLKVDIKPQGGYSIAPGSWHKGKAKLYEATDTWTEEGKKCLPVLGADVLIREANGTVRSIRERAENYERQLGESQRVIQPGVTLRPAIYLPTGGTSDVTALKRATAYMKKVEGASEGARGDVCFKLACNLVRGFTLADGDALALLAQWNLCCVPPLPERELNEKIGNARRYGKHALGSKLTERKRADRPVSDDDEPHHHHEGCGCDEPTKKKPRDFHLSESERINLRSSARSPVVDVTDHRLTKLIDECAMCCETYTRGMCLPGANGEPGHGQRSLRPDRCYDQKLCPNCARVLWRTTHQPTIEEKWPEEAYVCEVPILTPESARDEVRRMGKLYRKNLDEKGRWFTGWKSVLYVFDPEVAEYAEGFGLLGKIMRKSEYLPIVERVWLSQTNGLIAEYRSGFDMVTVVQKHAAILGKHTKRTSAGKKAQKLFPWLSTTGARELAREVWKKNHPGLERGECDFVTGHNPDGSPIYCKRLQHDKKQHKRTGEVIGMKRGGWKPAEIAPRILDADNRYIADYTAKLFTADIADTANLFTADTP